jgi:hypothetical protein
VQRLVNASEALATKQEAHAELLHEVGNITIVILETLGETASSATVISDAFSGYRAPTSLWLYVGCPVASLVLGSYGLPPSLLRNIVLVALGGYPVCLQRSASNCTR